MSIPPDDHDCDLCWPLEYTITRVGCSIGIAMLDRYADKASADEICASLNDGLPPATNYEVVPIRWDWRERAMRMGRTGFPSVGTEPVWRDEMFHTDAYSINRLHYALVPHDQPGCISFFENTRKAMLNQRTVMRAGRYLMRYFGAYLTEKQITSLVKWQETGIADNPYNDPVRYPVEFANTADMFEWAYVNGPYSCMSYDQSESAEIETEIHPVRMYGTQHEDDLSIAYVHNPERRDGEEADYDPDNPDKALPIVLSRVLVRRSNKTYSRAYPTPEQYTRDDYRSPAHAMQIRDALTSQLRDAGYRSLDDNPNGFNGAHLRYVIDDNSGDPVMPYMDHRLEVKQVDGKRWVITRNGIRADTTNGKLSMPEDEGPICDCCGDYHGEVRTVVTAVNPSSGRVMARGDWCESCLHEHDVFWCHGSMNYYDGDIGQTTAHIGSSHPYTVSQVWADRTCARSEHDDELYSIPDHPFRTLPDGRLVLASAYDEYIAEHPEDAPVTEPAPAEAPVRERVRTSV